MSVAGRMNCVFLELDPDFTSNSVGEYELHLGDLDAAEQAWMDNARQEGIPAQEQVGRLLFAGLRDPAQRPGGHQRHPWPWPVRCPTAV